MKKQKRVRPTETLATRGKKVSIKSHSRRTRGGRRVVVRNYTRKAGGKNKSKTVNNPSSGTEFEALKNRSPYGEPITKRLHAFQGAFEDGPYNMEKTLGDKVAEHKRKVKEHFDKDKELSKVEKVLDKLLRKNGYQYKKYL